MASKPRAGTGGPVHAAPLLAVLLLAVLAVYSNHFHNDFQFDDYPTVVQNLLVHDLRYIPRFFRDGAAFSTYSNSASYRPVTSTSVAIDYWLARGLHPFWFHVSTFFWFLVQLILMFLLFRRIMDLADEHPSNTWTALFATAVYGLHPANAETVNYIIQRADLYNTLGVVASLLLFIAYPRQRKYCWYLLPAVAAYLAKPPALVFPFILLAYVYLFERGRAPQPPAPDPRPPSSGPWPQVWPAFAVTVAIAILSLKMTPASFNGGAPSASLYRLTQPWVALHYFKEFFLPTDLCADSVWPTVSGLFNWEVLIGGLFVAALVWAAYQASQKRQALPIAFGIIWFFLALLPTALLPLADVMNDHRMFFPFAGLVLAVVWALRLALLRFGLRHPYAAAAAALAILIAAAMGTHARNAVWHNAETLWQDVALKAPDNARGLMGYGHALMDRGDYAQALYYFERAESLHYNYAGLEMNLGLAYGGLGRDAEATRHFLRAQDLDSRSVEPYLHYGRWLKEKGRLEESAAQLETGLHFNPRSYELRDLLAEVYDAQGKHAAAGELYSRGAALAVGDPAAERYLPANRRQEVLTPESLVNLAAQACQHGMYDDCASAAKRAIDLRPDYAEAYNNLAAAYLSMNMWDEGIEAARKALALKPDYADAKGNLEWALAHRPKNPSHGK